MLHTSRERPSGLTESQEAASSPNLHMRACDGGVWGTRATSTFSLFSAVKVNGGIRPTNVWPVVGMAQGTREGYRAAHVPVRSTGGGAAGHSQLLRGATSRVLPRVRAPLG